VQLSRPLKDFAMPAPLVSQIDLREISTAARHAMVFDRFAEMQPGQTLELTNDHDPLPLSAQLEVRSPGQFSWEYLESGPQVWRVAIAKRAQTVAKAGGGCCGGCCG
jgi:uncharacterized protein (DUF2249 family)